jgi:4-diphosphocytidyl-2-C-methyl-D-erythritol kinase
VKPVPAAAKINLALVVGERRDDGLHEVATVLQRIDVSDRVEVEKARTLHVEGFRADTLVADALEALAAAAGKDPGWRVRIAKKIPVAAGLGGGSTDAAAALRLANATLPDPLPADRLAVLAARIGADVPFFLTPGPKLAEGAGERLTALELPQDFWVLVALPRRTAKVSTRQVYERFDALGGGDGFDGRKQTLLDALAACRRPRDFGAFPPSDLAVAAGPSPLVGELLELGAFRADVSGAGPAVYGLFHHRAVADEAARRCRRRARTWIAAPVW